MAIDTDPLLQPFQLKHLRLRNRIMTTSHEPAYAEDGLPKARYRAYHVERAKAGIALTMTAGSAGGAGGSAGGVSSGTRETTASATGWSFASLTVT